MTIHHAARNRIKWHYSRCQISLILFSSLWLFEIKVFKILSTRKLSIYWNRLLVHADTHYKTKFHLYFTFIDFFFKSPLNRQADIWILYACVCWHRISQIYMKSLFPEYLSSVWKWVLSEYIFGVKSLFIMKNFEFYNCFFVCVCSLAISLYHRFSPNYTEYCFQDYRIRFQNEWFWILMKKLWI